MKTTNQKEGRKRNENNRKRLQEIKRDESQNLSFFILTVYSQNNRSNYKIKSMNNGGGYKLTQNERDRKSGNGMTEES